jgi:hypothetical protein
VLLLGVSLLQFLEAIPDRQAIEMLRYHAGWNLALNCQLGDQVFHPTTLVHFRQRLLEKDLSAIGFQAVLDALADAGLVQRRNRQRLDSTQMLGRVSRMSRLDCVRETLRLALREISQILPSAEQPSWWLLLWERYVDTQTDYRASVETLARKLAEAGQDTRRLLDWLAGMPQAKWGRGKQVQLLGRVFGEQFELSAGTPDVQPKTKEQLGTERVQNPHDPEATYATKGKGEQRKEHVGYKVQVAETVSGAVLAPGEPTRNFIVGMVTHTARESDEEGAMRAVFTAKISRWKSNNGGPPAQPAIRTRSAAVWWRRLPVESHTALNGTPQLVRHVLCVASASKPNISTALWSSVNITRSCRPVGMSSRPRYSKHA